MEKKQEEKLFMSVKIPDSNDFIQGFGSKELLLTLIGAMAAILAFFVLNQATGNLTKAIAGAAILIAAVILMVRRDISNESLVDKLKLVIRYQQRQKQYEYAYYDYFKTAQEDSFHEQPNHPK